MLIRFKGDTLTLVTSNNELFYPFGQFIDFEDFTNKLKLNAKDFDLTVNKFTNKGEIFGINSINLIEPNLVFENTANNLKINTKNIDLKIKNISNKKKKYFK